MVIYDRQVNGVYPALNSILADVTSANVISPEISYHR